MLHLESSPYYGGYEEGTTQLGEFSPRLMADRNPFVMGAAGKMAKYLLDNSLAPSIEFKCIDRHGIIVDGLPRIVNKYSMALPHLPI